MVAESSAGRVVRIDETDSLTVLAEGLAHPVDVAFDARETCYVSDDRLGAVLRLDDGGAMTVVDGLGSPQGLVVCGAELFVVEVEHRRLWAVSLTTGESRIEAENLAVGLPPGVVPSRPATAQGPTGPPRQFAGLAVDPDGSLFVSANGEGTVLRLTLSRQDNRTPAEEAWK
ncbi:SMP-30/gluconolactonase/LRE family protein [Streptomyces sp. NPDC002143]